MIQNHLIFRLCKNDEFNWFSMQQNEINSVYFPGKKKKNHKNEQKLDDFLGNKTICIQLIFLPQKWAEISWFSSKKMSWNQLIFSAIKRAEFNWFFNHENKLNFHRRKQADFNWFSQQWNELNSVDFPATKMSWNKQIFEPRNGAEFNWFSLQ